MDPNPARPPRRRDAGYSLIEILTVLVVTGISLSIVGPRIDLQGYVLTGAVQSVGSTLVAAQRRAVQEQHQVVVAFDVAGGWIRIHQDLDNDGVVDAGEGVERVSLDPAVRFGRGPAPALLAMQAPVSFSRRQDGLPAVVFHRDGSASEEGGFYLTSVRALQSAAYRRDTRAVRIERSTGRPGWYRDSEAGWSQES